MKTELRSLAENKIAWPLLALGVLCLLLLFNFLLRLVLIPLEVAGRLVTLISYVKEALRTVLWMLRAFGRGLGWLWGLVCGAVKWLGLENVGIRFFLRFRNHSDDIDRSTWSTPWSWWEDDIDRSKRHPRNALQRLVHTLKSVLPCYLVSNCLVYVVSDLWLRRGSITLYDCVLTENVVEKFCLASLVIFASR